MEGLCVSVGWADSIDHPAVAIQGTRVEMQGFREDSITLAHSGRRSDWRIEG